MTQPDLATCVRAARDRAVEAVPTAGSLGEELVARQAVELWESARIDVDDVESNAVELAQRCVQIIAGQPTDEGVDRKPEWQPFVETGSTGAAELVLAALLPVLADHGVDVPVSPFAAALIGWPDRD